MRRAANMLCGNSLGQEIRDTAPGLIPWHSPYFSFHPQCPGNGRKILAPLPPCLDSGVPSNQQQTSQPCPMEAERNWFDTHLFLLPLQTQLLCFFHQLICKNTHTQRPNTEKSNLYPGDVYKHEALTGACKRSAPYCSMHICLRGSKG